jgi:hypothetical protein
MCYSGWTNGRVNMYTVSGRTKQFVMFGTRKRKVYTYNGEEYCKINSFANADRIRASVYVGADTPTAKGYEHIDAMNRHTDRLLDY